MLDDHDPPIIQAIPKGNDITLCTGGNCPHRFLCLRYLAEAVGKQDYFGNPPFNSDGSCSEFKDAREAFRAALNRKAIENYSKKIAQQNIKYADLIWMLAEMQISVKSLFTARWITENRPYPIVQKPSIPELFLKEHAYYLWKNNNYSVEDLHWFIAEQRLLDQILIERIYSLNKNR